MRIPIPFFAETQRYKTYASGDTVTSYAHSITHVKQQDYTTSTTGNAQGSYFYITSATSLTGTWDIVLKNQTIESTDEYFIVTPRISILSTTTTNQSFSVTPKLYLDNTLNYTGSAVSFNPPNTTNYEDMVHSYLFTPSSTITNKDIKFSLEVTFTDTDSGNAMRMIFRDANISWFR